MRVSRASDLQVKLLISSKTSKMDATKSDFHDELNTLQSTHTELVAFCERTRNAPLKIKEGVASSSTAFKRVKLAHSKSQDMATAKAITTVAIQTHVESVPEP